MSKKNKLNKNFNNEAPEIFNTDDIGYMTDEALHDRSNRLEGERNRLVAMGRDPHLWEVEIAYLHREQQLRRTRAARHMEYIQKFQINPNSMELKPSATTDESQGLN